MEQAQSDPRVLCIEGERTLLERFEESLRRALGERRAYYEVHVEFLGCWGEVLISIAGTKGRLPLIFGREQLEPEYVGGVVRDAVAKCEL